MTFSLSYRQTSKNFLTPLWNSFLIVWPSRSSSFSTPHRSNHSHKRMSQTAATTRFSSWGHSFNRRTRRYNSCRRWCRRAKGRYKRSWKLQMSWRKSMRGSRVRWRKSSKRWGNIPVTWRKRINEFLRRWLGTLRTRLSIWGSPLEVILCDPGHLHRLHRHPGYPWLFNSKTATRTLSQATQHLSKIQMRNCLRN